MATKHLNNPRKAEHVSIPRRRLHTLPATLTPTSSLIPDDDPDLPRKWVMLFPNSVAALASAYTTFTLVQDRKLLANILITV